MITLAGCAIPVPAVPLCVELSPVKGYCVNTITNEEQIVDEMHPMNKQTWWEMRPSMIYMPAQSWAQLKAFIIKICRKSKQCDTDLGKWERSVELIDSMVAPE